MRWGDLLFLFYAATAATVGELVVRTAAILIALSAIATITTKFVRWAGRMSRDLQELQRLARTGNNRISYIATAVERLEANGTAPPAVTSDPTKEQP